MRKPDDARTRALYTVGEAAKHAGTNPSTVKLWLCGDESRGIPPLFTERRCEPQTELWLCFLELVEVIVARRFREHHVSVDQLRQAREYARKTWRVEYPLAECHLHLLGGRVVDKHRGAIDVEWPAAQPPLPEFAAYATEVFEYDTLGNPNQDAAWATRFYPAGIDGPLMVDPRFAGGAVTFQNRGVTLETIVSRWRSKESIAFIASDFSLTETDVEAALQFALAS